MVGLGRKAEIVKRIHEVSGMVEIIIKNGGLAGKLFQYRIIGNEDKFQRVITGKGFIGTLKDNGIARSRKDAILLKKNCYITNSVICSSEEEANRIIEEVKIQYPEAARQIDKDNKEKAKERSKPFVDLPNKPIYMK
jgi:hypothetical protein